MKTNIGTSQGKAFLLDTMILADTRALICASSGAGKSYLLRGIAEQTAEKMQTVIIDPEGEFSTLRERLDILIVSENGDIKPDIRTAGLLARRLVETGVSAVIDIYDLPGKGDPWDKRRLFVSAFLTGLMNIPKNLYHPMLVIVDEAHNFAGESPAKSGREIARQYLKTDESPSMLSRSAIRFMMSAGRKRGIGGLLATQRISKIDKDSIADARNIFVGGTNLDIDQERAGDMLGMTKREAVSLRDLEPGEFYYFGAALGKRGVFRFYSALVKTTHPKAGQRLNAVVPKASTQIARIAAQFSDLPQEVQAEADALSKLQNEVTRLTRELTTRPVQVQPEVRVERVEVPVLTDEHLSGLASLVLAMNEEGKGIMTIAEQLQESARDIEHAIAAFKNRPTPPLPARVQPVKNGDKVFAVSKKGNEFRDILDPALTNPEQRILDAIAWFESIGIMEPRQEAVAFLAGYTYGGGAFNNPRGRLNTRGFVAYRGKGIALTAAGRNLATPPASALTQAELHAKVMEVLPRPHQDILTYVLNCYPSAVSKDELSVRVNRRGGAFNNPLGRLRTLGLIYYPEKGFVRAESFLFME